MHAFHRKGVYQFIQGEQFFFGAIIPSQQGQQIDECFGQKTALAKSLYGFAGLWIGPVHGKNREAVFGAVAFAELSVRSQYQWQVSPLGHGVAAK